MRPLVEQVAALQSAHVAAVEVLGRLGLIGPDGGDNRGLLLTVNADAPRLEIQSLRGGLLRADELVEQLGLDPGTRRSRWQGNAEVFRWTGQVAEFPVELTAVIYGARVGRTLTTTERITS